MNANGLVVEDELAGTDTGSKCRVRYKQDACIDVVVIFTKSMYTMDAITKSCSHNRQDTAVLTLQNGLGSILRRLEKPQAIIRYCRCDQLCQRSLKPGRVELKGAVSRR